MGALFLSPGSWCTQCFVCALQGSVSPVLWKFCNQIPLASKVKFPGGSQSLCRIPTLGYLWLYGGANGNLLQGGLCHTLCDPGLLQPEPLSPWQATADLCVHRRHLNTQWQVWLSLCGASGSWCTQGCVGALRASLVCMGFESKCNFTPPTILLRLLLFPCMWGIFFLVGSKVLLSMVVQYRVAILEFSQENMSAHPSTPPSIGIQPMSSVQSPSRVRLFAAP